MKRAVLALVFVLALSGAQAQDRGLYLGLHLDGVTGDARTPVAPLLGFRVGAVVADGLELRLSASTVLLASLLQADVLYTRGVSDALRLYGGGGGDVGGAAFGDGTSAFFVHATAGLEYRPGGGPGLFAEVQPLYGLNYNPFTGSSVPGALLGKLTLGINFYP